MLGACVPSVRVARAGARARAANAEQLERAFIQNIGHTFAPVAQRTLLEQDTAHDASQR